ncbi:MAG: aminotransferase class I/II-fold pyridoxal phosphate-dependent enzyme, partial [Anaerolineales bacterium]
VGQDVPTCYDIDPEHVILMSSYSKMICPGLRVGFMILPKLIAERLSKFAEDSYINCSFLNQAIVHRFAAEGWLDKHISSIKELYNARRIALLDALEQNLDTYGSWENTKGGFFVGFTLNKNIPTDSLLEKSRDKDLILTDGRGFFIKGGQNFLRLPFCALTEDEIYIGISRLQAVIEAIRIQKAY